MTDWTSGYLTDIGYTHGYYLELNPLRAQLAFLNAGLVAPECGTACELGFGQGLSANLHAAASVIQWHGTDFNPSQAGFAQELAAVAGHGAQLADQAFDAFAARGDLPEFDYIGLHGVWSWISDSNRTTIVDFIRRKLKVGGVLYISYNTQPGWADMVPMRGLLTAHAEVMGTRGQGIVPRIDAALQFAQRLLATNPGYAKDNPHVAHKLQVIQGENRHYVAHEYFNRDWAPMSFADVGQWLAPAKLDFACSANYLDCVEQINLSAEQQALLRELPDAMFRQTVRDFMVNPLLRKDYWVKGARRLDPVAQAEALRAHRVVLVTPRAEVSLKVAGALGEASLQEAVYHPILDALADHQPHTLGQLEQAVQGHHIAFAQIVQAVMILAANATLMAAQDEALIVTARKCTDKLNAHLIRKARGSADILFLASPVTGGGVVVHRFQQLFLLAIRQGKNQPAEWAQLVLQTLAVQGQKVVKDGKTLETMEENLAELNQQAAAFAEKQLPILRALQIA